ncbi:OpgC domain-containing protein [Paraburkholderia sp. J8-2]|uniref:OpgC domain-containing protein n=1 Tax=Paraburkholderia sp. J8-2 TaxID=2805440 RepID=UPI002AB66381|nr:OpgC domain-containing protein [Paraburkholderia sp. J8-2]
MAHVDGLTFHRCCGQKLARISSDNTSSKKGEGMGSSTERSVEVDFFRGVALLVIALDHNTSGVLRHVTLHTYAYCDAAEVFVFLGGYASAAAYVGVATRRGKLVARRRFLKRACDIYRAYLITAALMLACSAALRFVNVPLAAIHQTWPMFAAHPVRTLLDFALFRQQPFLSAVLPMYVLFAFGVPFTVPLFRRSPSVALFASLAVWLAAPWLGTGLPSSTGEGWPFNPFAWQLMFTLGKLSRLHPVSQEFHASFRGRQVTKIAIGVALVIAFIKLCIDAHASPGYMKQNLASVRIVSFLSIAWLCAQAVRLGWIRLLAERLWPVVIAGRQGLACFVGGTIVSIFADVGLQLVTRTLHLATDWPIRLAGDCIEIAALLLIGTVATRIERSRENHSIKQNVLGFIHASDER